MFIFWLISKIRSGFGCIHEHRYFWENEIYCPDCQQRIGKVL